VTAAGDPATVAQLDEKLGDLRLRTSAYALAQQDFARARSAMADAVRQADLWRKEGIAWEKMSDYPRALAAFEAAEGRGGVALSARARAQLELDRANVYSAQGIMDAEEAAAERASALMMAETPSVSLAPIAEWAAWHLAYAAWRRGDFASMEEWFGRMKAHAEGSGDRHGLGRAWEGLGMAAWLRGDLSGAEEHVRTALTIQETIGEQAAIALCWWILGNVALERAIFDEAAHSFGQMLALMEQAGVRLGVAYAAYGLGEVAWAQGRLDEAGLGFERSLAIREAIGDRYGAGWSRFRLGTIACERGELGIAARCFRRARRDARHGGFHALEAVATLGQVQSHLRAIPTQSRLRATTALLDQGGTLASEYGRAKAAVEAALLRAECCLWQGTLAQAQAAAEEALGLATATQRRREAALARRLLGRCSQARGANDEAEGQVRAALVAMAEMAAALEVARTRMVLVEMLVAQAGDGPIPEEARCLLDEALAQFIASGARLDLADAERKSATWRDTQ
jgi:tetratricopeptide (TPR) repeat protein